MTLYKRKVYCEIEFLDKFFKSLSDLSVLIQEASDDLQNLTYVSKFILQSQIYLNVDKDTFAKRCADNSYYTSLVKQYTDARTSISFLEDHKNEFVEMQIIRPEGLDMVYLLDQKAAICEHYANKYGVISLRPTCWQHKECSFLFRSCGANIKKGEGFKWHEIFKSEYHLSHCNSMIIIDNYIHKNIDKNLLPIIEAFLPKSLKRDLEFHLTIITEKKYASYDNIYNSIFKMIKKKRPELKFRLELYIQDKSLLHDRTILTNNVKVDSGAGFSLITSENGQSINSTEICILHPGLQQCSDTCNDSYKSILDTVRYITKKIDDMAIGLGERFPKGQACGNRLLLLNDKNN